MRQKNLISSLVIWCFISLNSSAEVVIKLSDLEIGQSHFYEWSGYPVVVLKRTQSELEMLRLKPTHITKSVINSNINVAAKKFGNKIGTLLNQSSILVNYQRDSLDKEIFIALGVSLKTGCKLIFKKNIFSDSCSNVEFDISGVGINNNYLMLIPPYSILNGKIIIAEGIPENEVIDFSPSKAQQAMPLVEQAMELISWEKYEQLSFFLKEHPEVLVHQDSIGNSILHRLSGKGKLSIIDESIKKNINFDVLSLRGETPLSISIKMREAGSISWLLNNGASKNKGKRPPINTFSVLIL
jgi:hypothetical protein